MFCMKCGNKIQEGDRFCMKCGNPITQEKSTAAKSAAGKTEEKRKIKSGKKKLPIIIGAAVLALVIIMLLKGGKSGSGSGFDSPEEAYDAWMTGFCQHDFDLTLQAEPDFFIKYMGGEDKVREVLQINYDNQIAPYVARGFVKFESAGHTMLEKDEMKELEQGMKDAYGVKIKISAAATIHQQAVSQTERSDAGTSGYAFKHKGKWYYINIGSM